MNVTITGGTGFVGRRLVARLLEGGHFVHLLVRHAKTGFGPQVRCSIWNAMDLEPVPESVAEADAVIHLAGEPVSQRWTPAAKKKIRDSRVKGTHSLIGALARLQRRPSVLVSASAMGIYGSRGSEVLTEDSAPGGGFLAEVSKEWESAAGGAEALGMRVVKLRLSMVLGKEGGALPQMAVPFRWWVGGQLAPGSQWMSWIHVNDLVDLILFCLVHSSLKGPVNACSPNPVTNTVFTRELAAVLGRPAVFTIPAAALRLLYGEMAGVMLSSARLTPRAATEAGFEFHFPELRPALQDLLGPTGQAVLD